MCGCCIRGRFRGVGTKDDGRHEEPLAQPAGDDKRVAAVVAGSRKDQDRAPALAGHRPGDLRCRKSGSLHQRQFPRGGFDGPQFGGSVDRRERRRWGHGGIIGAACEAPGQGKWTKPRRRRYTSRSMPPDARHVVGQSGQMCVSIYPQYLTGPMG